MSAAERSFASDTVRFTRGDAVERLRRLDPGEIDAVVSFETLEHLPDPVAALQALRELSSVGVKLVVSVPNSRTLKEDNEFHVTDFGYDEAMEALRGLEGATILFQHLAEGSLIGPAGGAELTGVTRGLEDADPEYASTFIAVAGFPEDAVSGATARLGVVATPNLNRYMIGLETANDELWRTNHRLRRQAFGRSDAAAAAANQRLAELERVIEEREERIEELTVVAKRNDDLYQQELAWHDAGRYRAVDWLRDRVLALPGYRFVRRLLGG